ncbi:MAG TPA: DUF3426 domain-containing protein [Burkholderiaceae bacterium]|jgi:predicted Zn finger-like uncharacterized protein
MALATQCPHCQTTFRVVHDQLKLRAGLVRCGSCKQIFNGIEHLLRPDQVAQVPAQTSPSIANKAPVEAKTFVEDKTDAQIVAETAKPNLPSVDFVPLDVQDKAENHAPVASIKEVTHTETSIESNDPLTRMTLMNFTHAEDEKEEENDEAERQALIASHAADVSGEANHSHTEAEPELPDPLDQAIEALQQKPWRSETTSSSHDPADDIIAAESDEPAFVTQARRRQKRSRMLRVSLWIASILLLFGLIGQSTYLFRNQLAAWFPQMKPVLATACTLLDCQVTLPSQIDSVSIESSELQALAPQKNTFALTILLRNYSSTAQVWPHIELTLNDTNEKALVRRVFTPRDYLPAQQDMSKGFASNSEQPVKILFELLQLKASGYRVYLFYP